MISALEPHLLLLIAGKSRDHEWAPSAPARSTVDSALACLATVFVQVVGLFRFRCAELQRYCKRLTCDGVLRLLAYLTLRLGKGHPNTDES